MQNRKREFKRCSRGGARATDRESCPVVMATSARARTARVWISAIDRDCRVIGPLVYVRVSVWPPLRSIDIWTRCGGRKRKYIIGMDIEL